MFSSALQQGDKVPLSSLYGALQGLSELGTEVVRIFILPKIKIIGKCLAFMLFFFLMFSRVVVRDCSVVSRKIYCEVM